MERVMQTLTVTPTTSPGVFEIRAGQDPAPPSERFARALAVALEGAQVARETLKLFGRLRAHKVEVGVMGRLEILAEKLVDFVDGYPAEAEPMFRLVHSSNLARAGYDAPMAQLYVRFHNGALYRYDAVPLGVFEGLVTAQSAGKYFEAEVKRAGFAYVRLDVLP